MAEGFSPRPTGSTEKDGEGFAYERPYIRGGAEMRLLTPMGINYDTVGDFYAALSKGLRVLVQEYGEGGAFDGDPALQMSANEIDLMGAKPVICLKTALAAITIHSLQEDPDVIFDNEQSAALPG